MFPFEWGQPPRCMFDRKLTYYLSGPMTGVTDYNRPLFTEIASELREHCLNVIVPHELIQEAPHLSWQDYMRADLGGLLRCDAMILLPGWTKSRGCQTEFATAAGLGLEIFFVTCSKPRTYVSMTTGHTEEVF